MSDRENKLSGRRIAVIGGGVAGLVTAFRLAKTHEVTLFEASATLGGHAHSEELVNEQGQAYDVDTAFLIFNERTYPHFLDFLRALGVESSSIPAEMSSCFDDPADRFAYTMGAGPRPFLARPDVLLNPRFHRILREIFRFRRNAARDLDSARDLRGVSAGEYFRDYNPHFVRNFVWPLTAAIWSLADGEMSDYPISTLLEYFDNHQLIRGRSEKKWRTLQGSSRVYVAAFERGFQGRIRRNTAVQSVRREVSGVGIYTSAGAETFDGVVLATHADLGLRLIEGPTVLERNLLGSWRYKDNPTTLHHDVEVLHSDARLWGSWNMRREQGVYRISYYLNRLQRLPTLRPVILTLGTTALDEAKVVKRFNYRHPIFDLASAATQKDLPQLNGRDRIWFCGSYFGHGFHEDAVRSAIAAADGVQRATAD